ncbi:hypothetical protein Btru_076412 [Bulinus truncatus]|nr:hypothetical protein Btru_076412 [Bulinus truncatus]
MSNAWNNQFQTGLPNPEGQVKLFDPSQYPTPATSFGLAQGGLSNDTKGPEHYHQGAPAAAQPFQNSQDSWNSWGGWGWGVENTQTEQHPAQQGPTAAQYQTVSTGGNQFYDSGQFGSVWNQNLDERVNYNEQQNFPPGGAYNDPAQGQQQYAGDSFNQGQYHIQQQAHLPQQQQHSYGLGQFYDQPQQASHEQPQNQQRDQGLDYQLEPRYQSQEPQGNIHYSQPHSAQLNAWDSIDVGSHWVGSAQTQQAVVPGGNLEEDNGAIRGLSGEDNAKSLVESQTVYNSEPVAINHSDYNNDDDGTVSGFFGHEEDGNVTNDRPGQGHMSQSHDSEIVSGFNRLLNVNPSFHRTSSDISNASLATLNLSTGEEDDSKEPLHNVEELVNRMAEVDLSHNIQSAGLVDSGAGSDLVSGQLHRAVPNINYSHGQQTVSNYPFYFNTPPQSLPINPDERASSPDGEHSGSAESGGSGISGGSSGLTDWEIVPPQSAVKTLSQTVTPDSTSGLVSSQSGGSSNVNRNSQGFMQQAPGRIEENIPRHSDTLQSSSHQEPPSKSHSDHIQGEKQSRGPFVGVVSDVRQEESSKRSIPAAPVESLPGSAKDVNQYRRGGPYLSEQMSMGKPLTKPPTVLPPTSTALTSNVVLDKNLVPSLFEQPLATLPLTLADVQKDSSASPSKPKVSTVTSIEDGSRVSRRENDQSFKKPDSQSALPKQTARKGSQDSIEVASVSEHRRHHSAFHPVSRPRQTTMSPATTLWDNNDAPKPNILLAPAVPLIIPGLSSAPAMSSNTRSQPSATPDKSRTRDLNDSSESQQGRDLDPKEGRDRGRSRDDKNRSFDSLDEIDAALDRSRDRSYRSNKDSKDSRDWRYSKDGGYNMDADLRRGERPLSRSGQYQYERPYSRTEGYVKDDGMKYRSSYKDYGDGSFDERYDRPRSRQDEMRNSRPSSRSAHGQEVDRSRHDYDRDYYNRDRNRGQGYGSGYGYENYGRNVDYYNEERERWYRYYKDKEARYTRGYYEEYYGAKHAEYYQLQQQQQQSKPVSTGRQEVDRLSSHSQSRGNTPGVIASPAPGVGPSPAPRITSSPGPDYYSRSSRPASRNDYNRDYYRAYGYQGYDPYYNVGYDYDPYAYGYGYQGYEDAVQQGYDQGRLTPPKYSYPHMRASFGPNGQLIKVHPNRPADGQPAIVEVQDVQRLLESCPEAEEFKQYPGPLTRTNTHKKDVLLFCQQKARSCAENINLPDRESAHLLWRFLELLIKQNGLVVGTDLSDLLLEGHESSTHEYSLHGMKASPSLDALDEDVGEENNSSMRDSPAVRVTSDKTVIMTAEIERERWIDRFRHLLLYGRKKDALECAMKNHLWGHALFLASKMDARTHANVMTRFANSAMRINDPLQTLYQLMSGRQPAAVTCVVDERWGDWRPHLAMILSNQTSRSDIDRKSITTLGDTLAARGYLHASHFCYLMAQVSFGTYSKKTSKIVLIGSSHNLPMEEFASNEAIQCTEVFEYAQMLGNAAFCLPHFQLYKYLYACRLVDYGMAAEALHYLEVIATNIQQYPTVFQPSFATLVYQLANRLKFSDPQRLQLSEDAEDPLWLQQLVKICSAFSDGSLQPISGTATPAGFPGTTTSSESGDYSQQAYTYGGDPSGIQPVPGAAVAGGDVYAQQQYPGQPGLEAYQASQSASGTTSQHFSHPVVDSSQLQHGDNALVQHQTYGQHTYDYSHWQQQQQGYQYPGYGEQQQQQQQHQQYAEQPTEQMLQRKQSYGVSGENVQSTSGDVTQNEISHDSSKVYPGGNTGGVVSPASHAPASTQQAYSNYGYQHQQMQRPSLSTSETTEDEDIDDEEDDEEVTEGPASGFDYFGNIGQQKVVAPPHRYRTLSSSSAGSTSRRRRTTSGSSTGSVKAAPYKSAPQQHSSAKLGEKVHLWLLLSCESRMSYSASKATINCVHPDVYSVVAHHLSKCVSRCLTVSVASIVYVNPDVLQLSVNNIVYGDFSGLCLYYCLWVYPDVLRPQHGYYLSCNIQMSYSVCGFTIIYVALF